MQGFIVVFNPSIVTWKINTSNPIWQVIRWTVWRSPIMRIYGYDTYIKVLYFMVVAVFVAVLGLVWLTLAMRKQEQSKWLKTASKIMHVMYDLIFMMLYVSFFDYFVFTANCNFASPVKNHVYFESVMCLEMPHILHMAVACVTACIFFCVTALMVVASSDLNPVSQGYLASPAAVTRLKILTAKAIYIIVADDMQSWPKPQVAMVWAVGLICWWNFRRVPFYRPYINVVWCPMWVGILYTCSLLLLVVFGHNKTPEHKHEMTMNVLYGIFPVMAGAMGITAVHYWWVMRPAKLFKNMQPGMKASKVYKLDDFNQVELLSRVMRKFDVDGDVEPDAAALGEVVIKAGMQLFPNHPYLHILYANFLLEVRKDGPAARTQLQLASKHSPGIIYRYQIFCTGEASKRLKDSQDGGMDLQAYIEFRRNFRAVLRVHKEVLMLQGDLWTLMMKSTVTVREVDKAFDALEAGTARAHQVYKRVLERYPTNGKLLRCYGKFLEDVKHDPVAATRAYNEASRNGGGDAIMNLDLSAVQGSADKPEFLTSMSMEDDAVIVINAEGTIMMVSQAVQKVFGYPKTELEGANVALLMPQPSSQRHPSYLTRYVNGGEPHILDTVREVVGLHKERYVFPMQLCVTRMSGTGSDSVFLGVARPMVANSLNVRAWVSPNGTFLCGDQMFASMCGIAESDLVGRSLASLSAGPEIDIETLLDRCRDATAADMASGLIKAEVLFKHRFLDPVPVDVTLGLAGTDGQRIYVLNCQRTDGQDGNIMVVDQHLRLRFCSAGISTLLGFPLRKLATMKLDQLLPTPYNTMHNKWIKDTSANIPPTSCRAGKVVHLLNENNSQVPVKIKIRTAAGEDGASTLQVVQVDKVGQDEIHDEKRLVITADFNGQVVSVERPEASVFDFVAGDLVGTSLCDTVDIFTDWRERNGESQLQLLILALLDKEQEMPGASWRVRVKPPPSAAVPNLPAIAGATGAAKSKGPISKSACLQVELHEGVEQEGDDEDATRIRVTLWRRDLLSGVVELDEGLVVRKASYMTGLIVGWPANYMIKKPLQRFLEIPEEISWDKLVAANSKGHNKKKGALKTASNRGTISPVMAFIGPHPDTGTMRILTQGVETLAPGGRPKITITMHPDTQFAGAHANLMRVLHLEGTDHTGARSLHAGHGHGEVHTTHAAEAHDGDGAAKEGGVSPDPAAEMAGGDADGGSQDGVDDARGRHSSDGDGSGSEHSKGRKDGSEDLEAKGQAKLHSRAASKSDFVAQWVRTLTNKNSGALEAHQQPPPIERRSSSPGLVGNLPAGQLSGGLAPIPEDGAADAGGTSSKKGPQAAKTFGRLTSGEPWALGSKQGSRAIESPAMGKSRRTTADLNDAPGPGEEGFGGKKDKGEEWEKASEGGDSSASGSQAASGITSVTDATSVSELQIDSRRGRLLKALTKLLCGPMLMEPLERLRLHSYVIIAIMLVTHVVTYVIIINEMSTEHHDINLVARQALAMDRSQLIAVRAMMGAYCERPNVTAKVSVCANSLNFTLEKLRTNINLMEEHHHFVYLGDSAKTTVKLMPGVYEVWTRDKAPYMTYLDTNPPREMDHAAAVWVMGSQFLANAREALYWLPTIKEEYRLHRTFNFLIKNGLGPLFKAYAHSLDLLVDAAWKSVDTLIVTLIVLLVVEALVIQVACLIYEWYMVQKMEHARLTGILAMVGLPGPILRQLATKEAKVLDDSDDDEDSDSDDDDEREERKIADKGGSKGEADATSSKPSGVRHPDGGDGLPAPPAAEGGERSLAASKSRKMLSLKERGEVDEKQQQQPAAKATAAAADDADDKALKHQHTNMSSESGSSMGEGGNTAAHNKQGPKVAQQAPMMMSGKKSAARSSSRSAHGMHINGKTLVPSWRNVIKFVGPFVLWNIALIIVYVVSLMQLKNMQGPLASLNMASHIIYRYTRVRAVAFAFVSADDKGPREGWRELLKTELNNFNSEYNALMYGGTPITQVDAIFNHPVPASTFASASFATGFFRAKRCFRYDQSACFQEGHQYYEVTHNGLDVMVRRMLAEMTLLVEDADEDVAYNGTRYQYMAAVGGNDLYEGLQQAAQLFVDYSIGKYNQVADLHTILLIVTIFVLIFFILFILWPHLARLKADATRQSALLSHVPPELDVRAHVKSVFRRTVDKKGPKKGRASEPGVSSAPSVSTAAIVSA
uniref:PAS domain sensory protein FXL1 n=1 Tax=Chlamydomonas reinhardtii TaxID=3055 RepID=B5A8X7_CHLRE|nr:PAS domain sensory protein FXL1 [Chlamydomonas reinhardtii]